MIHFCFVNLTVSSWYVYVDSLVFWCGVWSKYQLRTVGQSWWRMWTKVVSLLCCTVGSCSSCVQVFLWAFCLVPLCCGARLGFWRSFIDSESELMQSFLWPIHPMIAHGVVKICWHGESFYKSLSYVSFS